MAQTGMGSLALLLWRGIRLRCPRCGQGKLFRRGFVMYAKCEHCGWVYEREEGYWTGAMAVNLIVAEGIVMLALIPVCVWVLFNDIPLVPVVAVGVVATCALPLLFYRHSKSLWMTLDFLLHPVPLYSADHPVPDPLG